MSLASSAAEHHAAPQALPPVLTWSRALPSRSELPAGRGERTLRQPPGHAPAGCGAHRGETLRGWGPHQPGRAGQKGRLPGHRLCPSPAWGLSLGEHWAAGVASGHPVPPGATRCHPTQPPDPSGGAAPAHEGSRHQRWPWKCQGRAAGDVFFLKKRWVLSLFFSSWEKEEAKCFVFGSEKLNGFTGEEWSGRAWCSWEPGQLLAADCSFLWFSFFSPS